MPPVSLRAVFRIVIAGVLLFAALAKITELEDVRSTLRASELVPLWAVYFAPYLLAGAEVILAVMLLSHYRKAVSLATRTCPVVFSFFMSYQLWRGFRGIRVPCECFGPLLRLEPLPGSALAFGLAIASILLVMTSDCETASVQ